MKKLFFIILLILLFQDYLIAETPYISVYNAVWLSPKQLYSIISPSLNSGITVFVMNATNQLIISGSKDMVDKLIKDLKAADHKNNYDPSLKDILDYKVKIKGFISEGEEKIILLDNTLLCGTTYEVNNFEKTCYRVGRIREEDRFVTLGEKFSIKPYLKPGALFFSIELIQNKIVGWDTNGDPITRKKVTKKQFKVDNNKKSVYYLCNSNKKRVVLTLFAQLEDILE